MVGIELVKMSDEDGGIHDAILLLCMFEIFPKSNIFLKKAQIFSELHNIFNSLYR